MRRTFAILTLLFLVSLLAGPSIAVQNTPQAPQKPLFRPTGNEASVVGSIRFEGEVPRSFRIDMSADAVCEEMNKPHARTEDLVVTDKALRNAFVYVKSGGQLSDYSFEVPESAVTLTLQKCRYTPHVLGIRAGQPLSVINFDATFHNTHPRPRINDEWNQAQAMGAPPIVKTFSRPEQFIRVKCNQHPWEQVFIGVFAHPFFAVSDQLGNYEIRGLPPGTYKLAVWHERLQEQVVEITVSAGETRKTDFTFGETETQGWR